MYFLSSNILSSHVVDSDDIDYLQYKSPQFPITHERVNKNITRCPPVVLRTSPVNS